jgi:hypothetical protein
MIQGMTNIKLLDFSGFNLSNTTSFVKLFTGILLKLKKLKYLNFTNNIIDAKSYNEIFRLGNKAKPETANAIMMITDEKVRKIKFNTRNCSTPKFIDTNFEFKVPVQFYNSRILISYKNPAVDRQI